MLANSPDTTALFFNASFELSQSEPTAKEDPTVCQVEWAKEWIKQPISIDRINSQNLGFICTFKILKLSVE